MYRHLFSTNKNAKGCSQIGSNIKSGYFSILPTYTMSLPMYLPSVLFCNNLFVYCDYVSLIFIFHKTERPTMVEFGGRKNGDTRMQNKQHGQQLDEVN